MRLFEIFAKPNKVAITTKFASSYPRFVRDYPGLPEVFMDFVEAKFDGEEFGNYDYKFTGPLSPFYHAHLKTVDGLPVVIYDKSGGTLRLYDIVLHKDYQGPAAVSLRKFLRKAKAFGDFIDIDPKKVFSTGRPVSGVLKPAQKKQVYGEIAYLIANDAFETLSSALIDDDWTELENWLLEALSDPDITKVAIYAAFGGQDGLRATIQNSLKNYGKLDDFNKFISQ